MSKIILKSVICFALAITFCIGAGGFGSMNWIVASILCIVPLFVLGSLCVSGWFDDLLVAIEDFEKGLMS